MDNLIGKFKISCKYLKLTIFFVVLTMLYML
jgi:hypothetical protein